MTQRRHRSRFLRPRPAAAAALALALAGGAAAAGAAPAQDSAPSPPLLPARDVAVTYRLTGPGGAGTHSLRIAWLTAEGRVRLDLPAELGGVMLLDRRAQRAFLVMDQHRLVVELPSGGEFPRLGELPPGARLTREGRDRVAGLPCTVWRYQDHGRSGRACITEDGVLLRASGPGAAGGAGDDGALEAVAVAYGPQDPASFRPPPGYRAMRAAPGTGPATRIAGR
ncbi:hypothetical protein [Caldovatus aquaticus]|uniref:DUF4412 domain-containing protein n=1 Tax=Caldovatus aquaticus TaxID=2865671 RepID=A0ABS7F5S2_9PROT|nr:hypothetical protein [Caldovatus aquaticus]MBW8270956.1 hypothetical protein [Caldovatus aquaticus]